MSNVSYKGTCHCGKVKFDLKTKPRWLVDCNCSICSKLGTLWGHSEIEAVDLSGADETLAYVWGDKSLSFHSCKTCGCTTHWMSLDKQKTNRMAVNFRLCNANDQAAQQVRQFDGANTWEYLD